MCLLLLAGTILLGHAIIPHHHHFIFNNVVTNTLHHDTNAESPANHSHEQEDGKTNHFVLELVVVVRSGEVLPAPQGVSASQLGFDLSSLFVACLPYIHQNIIPVSALFYRSDHQISSLFYASQDHQLRGPPSA